MMEVRFLQREEEGITARIEEQFVEGVSVLQYCRIVDLPRKRDRKRAHVIEIKDFETRMKSLGERKYLIITKEWIISQIPD